MKKFYVEVVKVEGDEVVKKLGPMGEWKAVLTERGLDRQLNHNDYYPAPYRPREAPCAN